MFLHIFSLTTKREQILLKSSLENIPMGIKETTQMIMEKIKGAWIPDSMEHSSPLQCPRLICEEEVDF